jgi:hypothetical protein
MPPRERKPVVRRPKVTERDPSTGHFLKKEDTLERRRLSVEMLERGASLMEVGRAYWSGDRTTAKRQVEAWYAENPNPDAMTLRRVLTGNLANLQAITRTVMEKTHYVVDKGSVVLDAKGKELVDDKPIYDGVSLVLKINDQLIKITPGLAAPKVVHEFSDDALLEEIARLRAETEAELVALSTEESVDDAQDAE